MRIGFYLQDGIEILDFAGPMEVFANAGYDIITISRTEQPIVSQNVLKIIPDYSIEDAPDVDVLAFFGGNGISASADEKVRAWIRSQTGIEYYFTVCTGAFFLGRAGLLDGLKATTFHASIEELRQIAPEAEILEGVRWVDNGRVITTAGVSAGIDGALHFVGKLAGFEVAQGIAGYMEYDKWEPGAGVVFID